MSTPLRATVKCDMGEGLSPYSMGDDDGLMKTVHLANIACGLHAPDFSVMNKMVILAKANNVLVGCLPSVPKLQSLGRRQMGIEPDDLVAYFMYQVSALTGFLKRHGLTLNHIKPHSDLYLRTSRSLNLARASVNVAEIFNASAAPGKRVAFIGLAGTMHQRAAKEMGVSFIAEWFADRGYSDQGTLLLTSTTPSLEVICQRVRTLLDRRMITTVGGKLVPLGANVTEVSICFHSDTPGVVAIAKAVKVLVDESNEAAGMLEICRVSASKWSVI